MGVTIAKSALTVDQLRSSLLGLPNDMIVVLSRDAEGNGYSPLADAGEALYSPDTPWSGEIYMSPEELARAVAEGTGWDAEEDAAPDDAVRALVLTPVN